MGHPIYHLEMTALRCRAEFRLNDVPVADLYAETPREWTAPPVNPFLVRELNVLDVNIHSYEGSTFDDAEIHGTLRRYEMGDVVAEGEGPAVLSFTIPEDLVERVKEEELELPQSFSVVFDNEAVDFSDELTDADPLTDEEALRDYGVHLRDLVRANDAGGLLAELAPKAGVWSRAYAMPEPMFVKSLGEEIGAFLGGEVEDDFERGDILLSPGAGRRIWELKRAPGLPLLRSVLSDGALYDFRVWVGARDGALRIVR